MMPLSSAVFGLLARRTPFYVVSHERSGTHLTINTLFRNAYVQPRLLYVGDWLGPYDRPNTRFAHLEGFRAKWPATSRAGGIIKTHADVMLFREKYPKAKVVYVLRDPRDTLVSFFHYLNSDELHHSNPGLPNQRSANFAEFLRRPPSDYLLYGFSNEPSFSNVAGRWASHVAGWLAQPGVCVVTYEQLRANFRRCVLRICFAVGLWPRLSQRAVGLHDAPSVLPRSGHSGGWREVFSRADEELLRTEISTRGLDADYLCPLGSD